MKILLVGGAGYIGLPLMKKLINQGHDVAVFDSFQYKQPKVLFHNCTLIEDNLSKIDQYKDIIDESDIILYMASPRLLHLGNRDQIKKHLQYLVKFLTLLKNQKLFFFSSCSVYGTSLTPCKEESTLQITSHYSELKIRSEEIIKQLYENYTILRLSTLFGYSPVKRNDLLINNFIRDIKELNLVEVYDKLAWRPNIYLDDCINVLCELVEKGTDISILNIGFNSLNITKKDILKIIKKVFHSNFETIYIDSNDTRSYFVNFDKLENNISTLPHSYEKSLNFMI